MGDFNKLLKFLHTLVFIIGLLLLAGSIYLVVKAWPEKPSFDPKVFWGVLNAAFFVFVLYSFNKSRAYRPHLTIKRRPNRPQTAEEIALMEKWRLVRKKAFSGDPDAMKLSIIEADKILNEALKNVGFTAETTKDKILQILSDDLMRIRVKAAKANEYYQKVEEIPDFEVDREGVKKALHNYEAVLKELDLLDPVEL